MNRPDVSVIVPVYNVERYFGKCMEHLMNQTLKTIEIILVDDGSTDNCPALCDEYVKLDDRIRVIHKENGGLGFARNSGLDVARGEYVAFLDSDDYVSEEMYEKLLMLARTRGLDTILCGFNKVDENGFVTPIIEADTFQCFRGEEIKDLLLSLFGSPPENSKNYKFEMCVWRGLYKRDVIESNGIRFCSERELISEDLVFAFDYYPFVKTVGYIPEPLYYYRTNNNSLTHSFRKDRYKKNEIMYFYILKKMKELGYPPEKELYADRFLLSRIRVAVSQIVLSTETIDKPTLIKEICNEKEVRKLCKRYPYIQLPIKQKLFFLLLRWKNITGISLVVKAKNMKSHKKE